MVLPQTRPISIPVPTSPSSSSPRSHFRSSSDAGSDISVSLPLSANTALSVQAAHDPFAAYQLQQTLACFSAQDILSCNTSSRSRLVVLPETISIEAAGERLAEADGGETWIVLKSDDAKTTTTTTGGSKLRTSECAGLLGLEDLSAFFAAVFGPHFSKGVSSRSSGLVSPPASPSLSSAGFTHPDLDVRVEAIRARLDSRQSVTAALVSNLSGHNRVCHISLQTPLQDIIGELSRDQVSCLVVSDLEQDQDGAVCGTLTASDVVAFLVAEAENDGTVASVLAGTLDALSPSLLQQPAAVISGDKSTVDALTRMRSEQVSVLAVMDPLGGLISPISSRELAQEILRSSSRKILTTPLSSLVKDLRSRYPQGSDGKDVHPAISMSSSSSFRRAASMLLATESGGVFVVDEPRVVTSPPLSCVSASPAKEMPSFSLDADVMPLSRSVSFTPAPAQKHRRSSTQFWTTPRASISGATSEVGATRPALPNFALSGSALDTALPRRASLKPESSLSSSVSSLSAKNAGSTMPAHLRTPSFSRTHRPRSLSLAHFQVDESAMLRQFSAQMALGSQGSWTPSTLTPSSSVSSAGSPSSPFGNMLVSGFFGEVLQKGMPRRVVTMKTILRSLLAAMVTACDSNV
ncbi:hypothetical protein EX895_006206 [Sporisorium graminicola]|uniref:CBS domain-containing protein n=1 Tax=Sporisorium graminicola TaxID=280036 RepID=A0A4U7KMM1_9BASI|nr:hypothetical protein EX895_006206 [Sporisorium graminicola]TKY85126.1 hypothetical protein EX895_006206 [Sporisorium graminicola]